MEEAQSLCDRLAIIDHGKIIAEEATALRALAPLDGVEVVQVEEGSLTLAAAEASARLSTIFQALDAAGAEVRETTLTQPNLETLFMKLTGKELRE
jgi:ABC-2 type transport system ATP-binding protein